MTPWMVGAGRMQQANPLTKESLQLLDDASKTARDGLDGIKDGVIDDPRRCTEDLFDIDALACTTGQREGCLTRGQIETARYMYSDVVDANGHVISPGVMPGAEAAGDWTSWMLPNEILSGYDTQSLISEVGRSLEDLKRHDPDFDLDKFDPVADRHTLDDVVSVLDVQTADLTEFHERGGKLLMYQGWNDYPLRPQRAIDYLAAVNAANGGAKKARDFFRLYMVPGMVHCAGGPGAWSIDYLGPLVDWVEQGEAPEHLFGAQPDAGFTRRHCAYPELAHFAGGDPTRADSYVCQ